MIRRLYLAWFVVLIAMGCIPARGAAAGSVSGTVRDSAGVPQIGAVVQLLRPDMSVIASVYTNGSGRYSLPSVLPGHYAVKAMGASYLPSLRENVRVRTSTIVNLTLSTLYEVMQWLPIEPRADNAQKDDWAWTLRSAANRPLLRWLEDGPLVVVSDGAGSTPRLKARLMATGQDGTFGESGERFSATVEETPSDSRELLAQVDFAPNTDAGMESMLGFRQDLGYAGSVQSVAAIAVQPEVNASGANQPSGGLDEAALRTSETLNFGDEFVVEAGSEEVLARFREHSLDAVAALLPFASVGWRDSDSTLGYSMSTALSGSRNLEGTEARSGIPEVALRNGSLVIEHGLHQQLGWERQTDTSGMAVLVYSDRIANPVMDAMGHFAAGDLAATALLDRASGMMRVAGPEFSSAGLLATVERNLPSGNSVRLSYANGEALTLPATPSSARITPPPSSLSQVLAAAHPRHAQMYSLSLSGTLEGTGTRWRASYRWQPEDTVTRIAPFAENAAEPWLNLHLRQPIYLRHMGANHVELLLDVRNLLAESYRPLLFSDGSYFIFAQDQRGVRGGLAFTF
jgi:hypothetical protein